MLCSVFLWATPATMPPLQLLLGVALFFLVIQGHLLLLFFLLFLLLFCWQLVLGREWRIGVDAQTVGDELVEPGGEGHAILDWEARGHKRRVVKYAPHLR